jgi:hypothetical protein
VENSGDNSDDGSDGDQVPEQEEDSPKVDISGYKSSKHLPFVAVRVYLYIHLAVVFCLNKLFCKL